MLKIVEEIESKRHQYHSQIESKLADYLYREKRYNVHFSLVAIYFQDMYVDDISLYEGIRRTDTIIKIDNNLICVIFDATSDNSYIKVAENLNKFLLQNHPNEKIFISSIFSKEFFNNDLQMTNKLFERLEDALRNNLVNSVVSEDYLF